MTRIVQIVAVVGPGSGVAGVAWNLEREWRSLGAEVEDFTFDSARRRAARPWPRRSLARRFARAWRTIWFSTAGTIRAREFLAERPGAVSLCHHNVLAGDVYVSHGVINAAMNARGNGAWRMLRNPTHIFTHVRDRHRFRSGTHRRVVALSHEEARVLRATYGRIRPPIVVIPNGVDLQRFHPPTSPQRRAARETFHLDDEARVAIFVGHEFERKGLSYAIDALVEATTVLLLVVGGSAQIMEDARHHAERIGVGDRVLLVGPRQDLELFLAAADFFVLPSAYESNALVILEALAAGLPVITTRTGYAPEIIVDGSNGYLVDRDPHELAKRFEELAAADLGPWSQRARASVEDHGWTAIAQRYLDLFAEVERERAAP
ncbi:glycosyltransferase family 4 protein [Microbacterium rhizosphaerae]|uniref:Glycosyltransferase family 4 protein n=1 Tax=Microbacterium rhizosphaerae TaxID=1678237 RepID=A0ABZ0SN98_9MICO|nr:glycosyltransferase family 4 protein [Microbacterium rhizosphaerae]WPR89751.1 glycosyltransferase family 4 protein [Microbacterium rhizosphaerae]